MSTLFEQELLKNLTYCKNKKILVAFSGGADSSALLYALVKNNFDVIACHVNHSIRGELADRDEKFCEDFCKKLNIELIVKRINVPEYVNKNNVSVEDAARKLRYEELFKVFEEKNADYIFTAHHLDDLVETFFVKLFQGSSIYNLKGFGFNEEFLKRPLLYVEKGVILDFIEKKNIQFVVDETNFSSDYVRNWLRAEIIPAIKSYSAGYLKNVIKLQNESGELKNYLLHKTRNVEFDRHSGYYSCNLERIVKLDSYEKKFVLAEFFKNFFRVEKVHVELALECFEKSEHSVRINLPKDYIFEKSYDKIYFFNKNMLGGFKYNKSSGVSNIFISEIGKHIEFSGEFVQKELTVRNRLPGDRFKGKKVKDLFIDKKIDLFLRDISCVVESCGKIIYVENITESENIKIIMID
ncbi:tRNA lysidine(34) synthetase TilS [Deferribacterales bacterium Es71-Z0220]|uniref:tRNA lysidine(34) synthetase TilS n=1 Tax=Deferrivibrio essentukiensis TaxID=2880922 RepID=UPI001F6248BB|nr:tRNA lysidine(34) synthetase TilS [Deferrivibrio essentukiensis]MCB4204513.1 tRNA lysidine(34) synthetase TilS [Deferrivibrio essentukiensis]